MFMKFTMDIYEDWGCFMCSSVILTQNHKAKHWGLFLREGYVEKNTLSFGIRYECLKIYQFQ